MANGFLVCQKLKSYKRKEEIKMKTEIMTKASRLMGKVSLQFKKHSPEIFMVAGIAGTVASTVLACKATRKIDEILDQTKEDVNTIHAAMEVGYANDKEYTQEDGNKDLTITYARTGVQLVKLYAPSVALGALSITSIVAGHKILKKRNIALAAAYAVVDKSFKDYRGRVVERFGEALDKELRYNIKAKEIEEVVVDENGNQAIEKKTVTEIDEIPAHSEYARFFDEGSPDWQKNSEYNLMFLRRQQDYANEILKARGHIFLNEVYDMLGIPRTQTGQVVGWIYDEKNPNGDNYVDFGIYDVKDLAKRNFVNGFERNILLDFNVDGTIYDKI